MVVQVLFFGATADIAGNRSVEVEMPTKTKASDVFEKLLSDYSLLGTHRLLFSVNQQYATGDETLVDGDELAIFTAVSGG